MENHPSVAYQYRWLADHMETFGDKARASEYRSKADHIEEAHNWLCHEGQPCPHGIECTQEADYAMVIIYESFQDPQEGIIAMKAVLSLIQGL